MSFTKEDLINEIIKTHISEALRVGFEGYDDERQGFDMEYLGELTPSQLAEELVQASLGGQFNE